MKRPLGQQPREPLAISLQLANWVGSLINDVMNCLSEIQNLQVNEIIRQQTIGTSAELVERVSILRPDFEHPPIVTTGLGLLTTPLLQPPNLQPRSSAHLTRSIQNAFARSGDIASQLLTVFQPQFASTIYAAYSSAQVTPQPQLKEFDALRVKAVPFGSNAPKQAITTQSFEFFRQCDLYHNVLRVADC